MQSVTYLTRSHASIYSCMQACLCLQFILESTAAAKDTSHTQASSQLLYWLAAGQEGSTPLDIALEGGRPDVISALVCPPQIHASLKMLQALLAASNLLLVLELYWIWNLFCLVNLF